MTGNELWKIRDVLNEGILSLRKTFDSLDGKAKFWMGISLTGFVGITSFLLQQKVHLSNYLIFMECSIVMCLIPVIYYLSKSLEQRILGIGVSTIEKDEKFESFKYFLKSDQTWEEFEQEQFQTVFQSLNMNADVCLKKAKALGKAEALLFWGIPICLILSILIGTFIYYKDSAHFWLINVFSFIPSAVFYGILLGIFGSCISLVIVIFRHRDFP